MKYTENKLHKFKVGEVAILKSNGKPEYNGEYTVLDYASHVKDGHSRYKGIWYAFEGTPEGMPVYDIGILDPSGNPLVVSENVLFKKHLPGEMSYDTLMSSLKLGVPVRV